MNRMADASQVL